MRTLAGAYRVAAMALLFTTFGIGALLLSLLLFPATGLVVRGERRRRACRAMTALSFRLFLRVCSISGLLCLDCDGPMPGDERGRLYIANHPSLLDYVILSSMIPDCGCLTKESVFKNPFMRGVARACGYIPNGGDPAVTVKAMASALERGENFLIFPEGTRSVEGTAMRLHRGFAHAALAARCQIVCARIDYEGRSLRKRAPFYFAFYGRSKYRIRFSGAFNTLEFMREHQGEQECSLARGLAQLASRKLSDARTA